MWTIIRRDLLRLGAGAAVAALSTAALAPPTTAGAAETEIRISASEPVGSVSNQAVEFFKKRAEELSNGAIKVTVYPNHVLGTYQQALEQIRAQALTGLYESIGVLGAFDPVGGIEGVSYLYTDLASFDKIWQGPVGGELLDAVAKDSGFRMIGIAFGGFREMCLKKPVHTAADLDGVKIRAPQIPAFISALTALGANPTPIAYEESYTAIQQGIVSGIEQPLSVIQDSHFYQVCKNLVLTHHMATVQGFIFNEKWYQGLPAETRKIVDQAARESGDWFSKYNVDNAAQIVADLKAKGMTVIEPDLSGFVKRAQKAELDPKLAGWVERIRQSQ